MSDPTCQAWEETARKKSGVVFVMGEPTILDVRADNLSDKGHEVDRFDMGNWMPENDSDFPDGDLDDYELPR